MTIEKADSIRRPPHNPSVSQSEHSNNDFAAIVPVIPVKLAGVTNIVSARALHKRWV
jgi:hypothetical protein